MDTQKPFLEVAGRKNFGPAHALMTTPQPCVMIATWDKDHTPDVMMAAWAGQYDHNQIVVSMSKHKTTENIELTGAFTVIFADVRTVAESDYLGIVSGTKVPDKVAKVGFSVSPSPNVDAPIIDQYPLTLECKVVSWQDGILSMAIAQGKSLLLANSYQAPDFTTAQYYIYSALKSLQLNPEVTTIHFRHPLPEDAEMSLYRYFKAVDCRSGQ
jgi:hypothetical protein